MRLVAPALGLTVLVVCCATTAHAQLAKSSTPVGEAVLTVRGEPAAPWKRIRICRDKESACVTAVVNPATREIAGVGDRWFSAFMPTGNGKEVKRLTSVPRMADRLGNQPSQVVPQPKQ